MDRISLVGMRFEGRHGVSAEERALPQLLEVDVEIELDLAHASRSDELADTVDYGPLIDLAREVVEHEQQRLLEGVAGAIADRALAAAPRIERITVRVRKLAVPVEADLDFAQVEVRRSRDGSVPGRQG